MCTVCGCGEGETKIGHAHSHEHEHSHDHEHVMPDGTIVRHSHGHPHSHDHGHDHGHGHLHGDGHGHSHSHDHEHDHDHEHGHLHADDTPHHHHHDMDMGAGAAGVSVAGMSQSRLVSIEQDILAKNDAFAAANRQLFAAKGVFSLNLMSSPGSGKTTLLVRTLTDLAGKFPVAVIEGDQQTSFDADRIRATGAPALQINTGKGCHLDAQMITQAVGRLNVPNGTALFIENVGNLVCPAGFDLGEARKVVVLSVTEGEDKPLKYPNMFAGADVLVVTKIDLLPHLNFDVDKMIGYARQLNPDLEVIQVSSTSGEGLADWYDWITAGLALATAQR